MRKLIAIALSGGLMVGLLGSAQAAAPKPVQVWEDPSGDADFAQGLGASVPGGFDIVSGALAKNGKNIDFTVTHADMPPTNQLPEAVRFLWGFSVDGKSYRITVKSADIGKPNPVAQSDTDRVGKVDPQGFFRLEGDCSATLVGTLSAVHCPTIGYVTGTFDAASLSFTVSVPMKLIKAKPGSKIAGGAGDAIGICAVCWVTHAGERSLDTTIIDEGAQTLTYKVPK